MHFVIFDSTGNLVASFADEQQALAEMAQMGAESPEAIGELALITYDDNGMPVGDARILSAEDLEQVHGASITVAGQTHSGQTAYFPVRSSVPSY
jgi:hypothetical protein